MQLRKKTRRASAISLTPLIDVVFILLLFFMLSTQFTQQQSLVIKVPTTVSTSTIEPSEDQLFIKLLPDNRLVINSIDTIDLEQTVTNSDLQAAKLKQSTLHIDADDSVDLQSLISLTDRLSAMGFKDVNLRALRSR